MAIDKIIVIIVGLFSIAFIYWFFLKRKEDIVSVTDNIDIVVDGGYTPEVISIPYKKPTKIHFFRKDPSTCLEEVVISEFKIRKTLPLNQKATIEVTPQKIGEFPFSCGMGMFHGKIIVKK